MEEMIMFHELDSIFGSPVVCGYPHDVYAVKDEKGGVVGYGIDIALAGVMRDNVSVNVGGGEIRIKINKTIPAKEKIPIETKISRRAASLSWKTNGLDLGKIEARFADGMLTVFAPVGEDHRDRAVTIG